METKALIAMFDYVDTESNPDAADKLLVRKYGTRSKIDWMFTSWTHSLPQFVIFTCIFTLLDRNR